MKSALAELDTFARNVVDIFVLRKELPELLQLFSRFRQGEPGVNEHEAFVFALFPYSVMAMHRSFGQHGPMLQGRLIEAAAELGAQLGRAPDTEVVVERFGEYASVTFEQGIAEPGLSIPENGLHMLARHACRRIVGREVQNIAVLYQVWSHFGAVLTAWKRGAELRRLYDLMLAMGSEQWLRAVRAGSLEAD